MIIFEDSTLFKINFLTASAETGNTNFTLPGVEVLSPVYLLPLFISYKTGDTVPKLKLSISRLFPVADAASSKEKDLLLLKLNIEG